METKHQYIESARKCASIYKLCTALIMVSLTLAACAPQALSVTQVPPTPVKATSEIPPSITPLTTSTGNNADDPVVRSYHTLLMLEHSTDLILTAIGKIQNGEVSQGDPMVIPQYTNAFSVTVEILNEVSPPAEFEDPWNQVLMAAQQYSQAYTMINGGIPISSQNLDYLKETRKLLTIDQQMFEAYLMRSGLGLDFFVVQQQEVDQHLQQLYGDQPVPILQP